MKVEREKKHTSSIIVRGFVAVLALCILLALALMIGEGQKAKDNVTTISPTREELLSLVNTERSKVGAPALVIDPRLDNSAQHKADDMVVNDYLSHIDKNGRHGYDIAHEYAPDICKAPGENLAWNSHKDILTASSAMESWRNSATHYSAMTDAKYRVTGFGIKNHVIVEHFC